MKTNAFLWLRTAIATGALITQTAFAQTWQTVDDYQLVAGKSSLAKALAINPSGQVFVAGYGTPASTAAWEAQIHCSADFGNTWTLCNEFPSAFGASLYNGIASDSVGTIYAACQLTGTNGGSVVNRSQDNGLTWTSVDAFSGSPRGIAIDSAGNIYVVGSGGGVSWSVRKGTPGGASWSTVDSFNPGGVGAVVYAVFCHPTAGVFVTGYANTGFKGASVATVRRSIDGGATWTTVDNSVAGICNAIGADAAGNVYMATDRWTVRKSSNGGASWATVDSFQYCVTTTSTTRPYKTQTQCFSASAQGFARDAYGNLFLVGYAQAGSAVWIVRENPGGTGTWQTVDAFQYVPGQYAVAAAVAADSFGNVYVAGHGDGVDGSSHWIVRKR